MAAIRDLETRRIDIDDEGSDLFALPAVDDFRRRSRHYYEHPGLDQICAPELFAVEDERRTIFGRIGAKTHVRGVGAGIPFRKRERGNLATRDPRQIFFLLFFRAKEQQWLRDSNRLVRRNQPPEVCVPTADQ